MNFLVTALFFYTVDLIFYVLEGANIMPYILSQVIFILGQVIMDLFTIFSHSSSQALSVTCLCQPLT